MNGWKDDYAKLIKKVNAGEALPINGLLNCMSWLEREAKHSNLGNVRDMIHSLMCVLFAHNANEVTKIEKELNDEKTLEDKNETIAES